MHGADCTTEELMLSMRLYDIYSKSTERSAGRWVELARECLRQMEWASRQERLMVESIDIDKNLYPRMSGVRILGKKPLTLAPDDWSGNEADARDYSFTRRDRSTATDETTTGE